MTSSQLHIDLSAISDNYRTLHSLTRQTTKTAAAVKADGYGLGMEAVSGALYQAGCATFFTAQIQEAISLRAAFRDKGYDGADIAVLEGPHAKDLALYEAHKLTPVINHPGQAEALAAYQRRSGKRLAAILHIDTGMNRLGYGQDTHDLLIGDNSPLAELNLCLVMSHLACADEPENEYNRFQLEQFQNLTASFASIPKSFSNSGGIFLPPSYHFDLTRPGIALYGAMPDPAMQNKHLKPVVSWYADIIQIRNLKKGECAGYGAMFTADAPTRLATIAAGYADGYARALYQPQKGRIAKVEIAGKHVPLAGRVSMDLLIADVTSLSDAELQSADKACLLGPHYGLPEMAADRDTISYEVLTGLGDRLTRLYDGAYAS